MAPSNQYAEEQELNRVRVIPFQRINGCPTWQKYLKLKQHASKFAVGSKVDYHWTLCGAGHKYGLLADILGGEEYEDITGINRNNYDPSSSSQQFMTPPSQMQPPTFNVKEEQWLATKNCDGGILREVCIVG